MEEDRIRELFRDEGLVRKIQRKLPYMFKIAELSVSKGKRIGMEIGTLREQIIIALFIHRFGYENVDTNIAPNEREVDVYIKGHKNPISIKTKSGKGYSGIKLIWTVDWRKAKEFFKTYKPKTDIIFVNVVWEDVGIFSYIPLSVQEEVFNELGKENYIKLPRKGTNPRGIEISSKALRFCIEHKGTYKIPINWVIDKKIRYSPYDRWVKLWEED